MSKIELIQYLKDKNILNSKNHRKFCWKKYFDIEVEKKFNNYAKNYRSIEEAWFCLCNNVEPYICEVCGNLAKYTGSTKSKIKGYNTTCEKCSPNQSPLKKKLFNEKIQNRTKEDRQKIFKKRKETLQEKYGDSNYSLFGSNKFKEVLKEKYGNEHYNNREKRRTTNLEKYGVECNLSLNAPERTKKVWQEKHNEIIKKRNKTCLEKYGVETFIGSSEFNDKTKCTQIKKHGSIENAIIYRTEKAQESKENKYGDKYYHNKEQVKQTLKNRHKNFEEKNDCTQYNKLLKKYGQGWHFVLNIPVIYDGRFRYISNKYIDEIENYSKIRHNLKEVSRTEIELYNCIKKLTKYRIYKNVRNVITTENNKIKELDIYIPKLNLAIEYNGDYWHSSIFKDKYYHQEKTLLCYNKGIRLIHIYEHDWLENKEIILNNIKRIIDDNDLSLNNWISIKEFDNCYLTEPNVIKTIEHNSNIYKIYDEGTFIRKIN